MRALLTLFFWPGVVLLGILVGAASALIMIREAPATARPWTPHQAAGSADTDSYNRARKAICCLLIPGRREAVYYHADKDSDGRPLRADCTYRVTGRIPQARWWSLTVYGEDRFLIETKHGRFSVNAGTPNATSGATLTVTVSPKQSEGAWLPTRGGGRIHLMLRAYRPAPALVADPAGAALPAIRRVGQCP